MVYSCVQKYTRALEECGDSNMLDDDDTDIYETTTEGKKQQKAKNQNLLAIANLKMVFTTELTMGLV